MTFAVLPTNPSRKAADTTLQSTYRRKKAEAAAGKHSKTPLNISKVAPKNASSLKAGSAISKIVIQTHASRGGDGRLKTTNFQLKRLRLLQCIEAEKEEHAQRLQAMTEKECEAIQAACAPLSTEPSSSLHNGDDDDDSDQITATDILNGNMLVDISHAGGELSNLLSIGEDLFGKNRTKTHDYRTRRNRVENRTTAFNAQMNAMVEAYMMWMHVMGENALSGEYTPPPPTPGQQSTKLLAMDVFYSRRMEIHHIDSDRTIVSSVIRYGLIPCSPLRPSISNVWVCYGVVHSAP
ncbi:hypothetical protein BJ165DRAFT_1615348 [Panaeolus papilionaceus]|nr:hypothetical protein BJ165DRAFT_1615348 [Panaeolus papilionaceus]